MNRRDLLCGSVLVALWTGPTVAEQKPTPVIGFLSVFSAEASGPRLEAFRRGLAEIGYVEKRNLTVEYR